MADITRSKNRNTKGSGPSENDLDLAAQKAASKYQSQLLANYKATQQQTVGQQSQLLDASAQSLGGTAAALDARNRNADLRWLRQHGAAFDEAGRAADPETQALLRSLGASYTGAPSALDARLNQEAVDAGPSELSRLLDQQAQEQLRLGGTLSPEETRQADQSARGAWADRGLVFSNPALLGEVLNRQSVSDARLAGRQQFGMGVNQQLLGEQQANRGFQLGVGAYQEGQKQTGLGLAQLRSSTSPTMQLLNRGTNTGMVLNTAQGNVNAGTLGASNLTNLQDAYTGFLMNRRASQDIADLNARTGLQTGQMSADAASSAGNKQLAGSAIAGAAVIGAALLLCHVAREVYGETDPRWMEFRAWLLAFGSSRRQRRYRQHGPTIARWISTRPAYKARLKRWMDRCIGELHGVQLAA